MMGTLPVHFQLKGPARPVPVPQLAQSIYSASNGGAVRPARGCTAVSGYSTVSSITRFPRSHAQRHVLPGGSCQTAKL